MDELNFDRAEDFRENVSQEARVLSFALSCGGPGADRLAVRMLGFSLPSSAIRASKGNPGSNSNERGAK